MTYGHANYKPEILERTQNPQNKTLFMVMCPWLSQQCNQLSSLFYKGPTLFYFFYFVFLFLTGLYCGIQADLEPAIPWLQPSELQEEECATPLSETHIISYKFCKWGNWGLHSNLVFLRLWGTGGMHTQRLELKCPKITLKRKAHNPDEKYSQHSDEKNKGSRINALRAMSLDETTQYRIDFKSLSINLKT